MHHLVIAKNIPVSQAVEWLTVFSYWSYRICPKNDPTAETMMALKGDIFPDYNEKNFEKILVSLKQIKNKTKITNTNRIIYEFANK